MLNSFDYYKQVERPNMYLCNPNQAWIGSVNAIDRHLTLRFNDLSALTFTVPKIENAEDVYDKLETRRLIFVDKIGWFLITSVIDSTTGDSESKDVTCESHQAQLKAKGFSSEERVYRFYNPDDALDTNYNAQKTEAVPSIVGQLYQQLGIKLDISSVDEEPTTDYKEWTIIYIDDEINSLYRTLSQETTYGYDFIVNKVESAFEVVFEFDFLHHAIKVKQVDNITEPTNIYLSLDNLAESIAVTENAENIVTVLSCNGSDLDIRTVNPMGTNYIANFDYYKREVEMPDGSKQYPWMSKELIEALDDWSEKWKENIGKDSAYSAYVKSLQSAYVKEEEISEKIQKANLKVKDLQTARDDLNSKKIGGEALTVVESVDVGEGSLLHSDINVNLFSEDEVITGYNKEPAYAKGKFAFNGTSSSGEAYKMIKGFISTGEADDNGEWEASDGSSVYLYFTDDDTGKSYCKLRVAAEVGVVRDASGNVVTKTGASGTVTLGEYTFTIEKETTGLSVEGKNEESITIGDGYFNYDNRRFRVVTSADGIISVYYFYIAGYSRYSTYSTLVGEDNWIDLWEGHVRGLQEDSDAEEEQIKSIKGEMQKISDACEVQEYVKSKGDGLYSELQNYWIEGDYTNDTIAALDSTTMAERIDLANELMAAGQTELEKVSQPTFELAVSAVNFLELPEFESFSKELKLGRVITVERDDDLHYRPALTSIEYDLDDGDTFNLTFSTATKLDETEMTFADLLNETSSTSRTISANWSNLTDYTRNKETITDLIKNPLDRTLRAAQANMSNQEFTIDTTGLLGRKWYDDAKTAFVDEQMRITNNTILFTDDNWETVRTALGKIKLSDNEEAYGLIAEVLVGSLIMGETLKICNSDGTITLDKNGITINGKEEEKVFRATQDGDVYIKGEIEATSGKFGQLTISDDGSIKSANGNFSVSAEGNLIAKGGGRIGGYTISNTSLTNGNVGMDSGGGSYAFWAGANNDAKKVFSVTHDGYLYAEEGQFGTLKISKIVQPSKEKYVIAGKTSKEGMELYGEATTYGFSRHITTTPSYEISEVKTSSVKGYTVSTDIDADKHGFWVYAHSSSPSYPVSLTVTVVFKDVPEGGKVLGMTLESNDFKIVTPTGEEASGVEAGRINARTIVYDAIEGRDVKCEQLQASGDMSGNKLKISEVTSRDGERGLNLDTGNTQNTYELEVSFANNISSSSGRRITVTSDSELAKPETVSIKYKNIWGTEYNTALVTIPAGSKSSYVDVYAVIGIESVVFSSNNSTKLTITQSKDAFIGVAGHFAPAVTSTTEGEGYTLGAPKNKWDVVYARSGSINTSDANEKHDIANLSDKYDTLFDSLRPVTYIFNKNSSGRTHMGLIAQEVRESIELAGLTTKEVAAYCEWGSGEDVGCGLRYGEFIPLNIYEIQKLKKRVTELENELKELKGEKE